MDIQLETSAAMPIFGGFQAPEMDTHTLFLYLGIAIFLMHFLVNGISYDISLFGALLIFLGWRRIEMPTWIVVILWILIIIEILADIYNLQRAFRKKFGADADANTETDADARDDADDEPGENQ